MASLIQKLLQFRQERDWQQFHSPSNLSKSLVIEAAELLEHFQWQDEDYNLDKVSHEIADIYIYLLLLSHDLKLEAIALSKLAINKKKYPIVLSKGRSQKYTKLTD